MPRIIQLLSRAKHIIETTGIVLIAGLALYLSSETQGLASYPCSWHSNIGAQRILQVYNSVIIQLPIFVLREFPLEDVLKYI